MAQKKRQIDGFGIADVLLMIAQRFVIRCAHAQYSALHVKVETVTEKFTDIVLIRVNVRNLKGIFLDAE